MLSKKINTAYLESITDDFGVWQHAHGKTPAKEYGYALDDAARALIVYVLLKDYDHAETCLRYLEVSVKNGLMVGFFDEHRSVVIEPSSEDALGLAFWALAYAASHGFEEQRSTQLYRSLNKDVLLHSKHLRSHAYALIAASLMHDELSAAKHEKFILQKYNPALKWFEEKLRYANAVVPYALFVRYQHAPSEQLLSVAHGSLELLNSRQKIGAFPAPVGNREWYTIGQKSQDPYGQQPIDAAFMVLAWLEAAKVLKDSTASMQAEYWMSWFYGHNIWQMPLVDTSDGSCMDGLDEFGPNQNRGAESTIMYIWAQVAMEKSRVRKNA